MSDRPITTILTAAQDVLDWMHRYDAEIRYEKRESGGLHIILQGHQDDHYFWCVVYQEAFNQLMSSGAIEMAATMWRTR